MARTRLVLVGPSGAARTRATELVCSLKDFDYVSADRLIEDESARDTHVGTLIRRSISVGEPVTTEAMLSAARRWYWGRKTNRGFAIADFPSSGSQALAFDDWLEARDESLTACVCFTQGRDATGLTDRKGHAVTAFYRERGQLVCVDATQPAEDAVQEFAEKIACLLADQ